MTIDNPVVGQNYQIIVATCDYNLGRACTTLGAYTLTIAGNDGRPAGIRTGTWHTGTVGTRTCRTGIRTPQESRQRLEVARHKSMSAAKLAAC